MTKNPNSLVAPTRKRHDLAEAVRILREHQDAKAFAAITFHVQAGRIIRAEISRQERLGEKT